MIDVMYTLRTAEGGFEDASVRAEHVPRVGELVTFDHRTSYQVVDVLWSAGNEQQRAMITAYERDWHEHIGDVHRVWAHTSLPPADGRHMIELMQLIDWSSDEQNDESADSAIPDVLYHQLDNDRWIMLQNALIDWDLLQKHPSVDNDALFRLAVVYALPVFEGPPRKSTRRWASCCRPGGRRNRSARLPARSPRSGGGGARMCARLLGAWCWPTDNGSNPQLR